MKPMRILAFAALLTLAFAQEPVLQFEVATIKPPNPKDRRIALFNYPGGRIKITNYTFEQLLEEAFRVQRFQISGAPGWIESERFVIEAKPPASSGLSTFTPSNPEAPLVDIQRQMVRGLLIDRFQLKFHRESKQSAVYLLVKRQKDPKRAPTMHPNERTSLIGLLGTDGISAGWVQGGNVDMTFLASQLSWSLGRLVLDRTGLSGAFDFKLGPVYDPQERDLAVIAVRTVHELGLKLESSHAKVETLFIDHVEKPAAN